MMMMNNHSNRAWGPNSRLVSEAAEERVARLLVEARELGASSDPNILALFGALTASPEDAHLLRLATDLLQPYRIRQAIAPDPFRPYPGSLSGLDQGEIDVGLILDTGLPWRVPIKELPHWLIVGPTGQGKTNLIYCILENISGRLPYVLVTIKKDARRLLVDPPIAHYVVYFEELKLSLFEPPPGVDEETWIKEVINLLAKIFGLQFSRALLLDCCERLRDMYARYSQQQGVPIHFTPKALHELVARSKSKYWESAATALEILNDSTSGVFECSQGMPPLNLFLRGSVVLMIPGLKDDLSARFVIDWVTAWIYAWLELYGPNDGTPQCAIVLDDAQRFQGKAVEREGPTSLSHFRLVARQVGACIIAASQCPADLAPAALSQSGIITQVGGLVHAHDLLAVAAAFGLPPSCVIRLQEPGRGEFIAREALGRCNKPFAGVVRAFPPPAVSFSEADRQRVMAPLLAALPWKPVVPLAVVEAAVRTSAQGAVPARFPSAVSSNAMILAGDILAFQWDFLNVRYTRLGMTGRPGQQAKDELVALGWVKEHAIPRQGRPPILLEPLTPLGAALQRPLPSWGKGGFLHAFASQAVMKRFAAMNYTGIQREKFYGSKAVDVVGTDPAGHLVGVEVCISLSNVVDNIQKNWMVMPGFASMVVVCLGISQVRQAERAIAFVPGLKTFLPRIRVEPLARWI